MYTTDLKKNMKKNHENGNKKMYKLFLNQSNTCALKSSPRPPHSLPKQVPSKI